MQGDMVRTNTSPASKTHSHTRTTTDKPRADVVCVCVCVPRGAPIRPLPPLSFETRPSHPGPAVLTAQPVGRTTSLRAM
jgi:hypothetical protein